MFIHINIDVFFTKPGFSLPFDRVVSHQQQEQKESPLHLRPQSVLLWLFQLGQLTPFDINIDIFYPKIWLVFITFWSGCLTSATSTSICSSLASPTRSVDTFWGTMSLCLIGSLKNKRMLSSITRQNEIFDLLRNSPLIHSQFPLSSVVGFGCPSPPPESNVGLQKVFKEQD